MAITAARRGGDRGGSLLDYVAVLALVAIIAGAVVLAMPGVASTIAAGIERAVCAAFGDDCAEPAPDPVTEPLALDGDEDPQPSPLPMPPGEPPSPEPTPSVALPDPTPTHPSPTPGPPAPETSSPEVEAILAETPTGRAALDYVAQNPIAIYYEPGRGSSYNPRRIRIDSSQTPEQQAASYVHEVMHHQTGVPQPGDFDQANDYYQAMADFETVAVIASIEMLQELDEERGRTHPRKHAMRTYEESYEAAVDAALQGNPELSATAQHQIGNQVGHRTLVSAFLNGDISGSSTGRPYIEVWQSKRDKAQPSCILFVCW